MTRNDGTVVARRDKVHGPIMRGSEMWLGRELANCWYQEKRKEFDLNKEDEQPVTDR
ncbi:hypothetical protein WUBG_07153 [Wuchereria bancrofti]|uniref:Uncharacterized protein n=1 Tax=Wuchereria bancrofti TaxID=6293 RepID=J9F3M5_WUCBA|nr:hypothetical protein WUBG_07153 [Wuchereria bancrofti]